MYRYVWETTEMRFWYNDVGVINKLYSQRVFHVWNLSLQWVYKWTHIYTYTKVNVDMFTGRLSKLYNDIYTHTHSLICAKHENKSTSLLLISGWVLIHNESKGCCLNYCTQTNVAADSTHAGLALLWKPETRHSCN